MLQEKTSVVIVGAGPSGLALASELGMRGVHCLLIERNERVGIAPRAKTTNVRTRTHLRRWGIAQQLAEQSPFGVDYPSTIRFVTRLGGYPLAAIENASNCDPTRSELYPEHGQWVPQYRLEAVLREHVEQLPTVTLALATELVDAAQDDRNVRLTLRDCATGALRHLACDFAVGADGARSRMREIVGATMAGNYGLSRNYNVVFRAPGMREAHRHGPATMYWQVNDDAPSLIGPMDRDDIWFFMPTRLPDGVSLTPESAPALIARSTGIDLPVEVLSCDEWVASSLIADTYCSGRLFLIGDACHLHPPFGGFGMNMGIADGVDLGWKLAAVLQHWGGERLLESYQVERRAIHQEVIAEATANHSILSNDFRDDRLELPGPDGDQVRSAIGERIVAAKRREFHTLGTVLGGCYRQSPVIRFDNEAAAPTDPTIYRPSSGPGCLAPHAWMGDGRSLYDLFGQGFTLLVTSAAPAEDIAAAEQDANARGVPLTIVRLPSDVTARAYPRALTLVRSDQYVAWRGDRWRDDAIAYAAGLENATTAEPVGGT
ncbi:FAD-dependent monooxygenase [Sphingomonas sp.]|uniref:FAD-dependent monooxygenase n=1 Tax=Sphingomonas sp. TaxID=28214 RepID=UPI0025E28564|nr:FAD-dependent monooxygenase [Sphingomonas sp.]